MAGNTRGRLKERFEGIHRNLDWSIEHCKQCVILIDNTPQPLNESSTKLKESILSLGTAFQQLDQLAQKIYATL